MRNVLEALIAARSSGKKVIYTALVETRGSTPQKAGASMLVFEDGAQVGTLGGGCVEAEVKRCALENLASGKSEIAVFQLDHDYGWDDGLICGGRMTMLIAPVITAQDLQYYQSYFELIERGTGCTEGIVVDESVGTPGGRSLLDHNLVVIRSLGHAEAFPAELLTNAIPPLNRPRAYFTAGISYLPHLPEAKLVIVGAGHVGRQLARYATDVEFSVTVIDDRQEYCNSQNIPGARHWITGDFAEVLPELDIDEQTFCVIVTRGHHHDEEALFHLIKRAPKFLGMIGSRRKIRLIIEDLIRNGIDPELLKNIHAPIGLEIGSQTVPEIAISIVAQLIEHRNRRSQAPESSHHSAEIC